MVSGHGVITSFGRHLGGNAFLLGAQLHLLAVLRLELAAFLLGFQATELLAVLVAFLDSHQVATVDAVPCALGLAGRGAGTVLLVDPCAILFARLHTLTILGPFLGRRAFSLTLLLILLAALLTALLATAALLLALGDGGERGRNQGCGNQRRQCCSSLHEASSVWVSHRHQRLAEWAG